MHLFILAAGTSHARLTQKLDSRQLGMMQDQICFVPLLDLLGRPDGWL